MDPEVQPLLPRQLRRQQLLFTAFACLLGTLALLAPVWPDAPVEPRVGGLLVWAAILELVHGFRRATPSERRSAWLSGALSLVLGILLINEGLFRTSALVLFLAITFAVDALRHATEGVKAWRGGSRRHASALSFLGNSGLFLFIIALSPFTREWTVAIAGAARIAGIAFTILRSRTGQLDQASEDEVRSIGMGDDAEVMAEGQRLEDEEAARAPIDRRWIISLVLILFAIHLGRMGFDRTALGILSPFIAVVGDLAIALIIAYGIIAPQRSLLRRSSAPVERAAWQWVQQVPKEKRRRFGPRPVVRAWLLRRLRIGIRLRKASYSLRNALRNGLQIGLPFSAVLAATMPVWGMSWYFDTENWAAGMWDSWAASHTDTWREAMVNAVEPSPTAASFSLSPEGVNDTTDFRFVIIGDPGEGDPSQWVLKDRILAVMEQPDVRFMVISSDVIYPTGALRDYERKFWLPFKGVTKPVFAIPGNHDWYDALEGFAATFYTPEAARIAMKARIASDLHLSTTTDAKVEGYLTETQRLRDLYHVPSGFQQAPFFQVRCGDFVFIAIDTGVLRRLDPVQLQWVKQVLEANKGRFIFALLGHPFFAAGEYQGDMTTEFTELHTLLKEHHVTIAMAGDTHDLEYYVEPDSTGGPPMHHFVNGGGGAYLSLGAALTPEGTMPTDVFAHYPARGPLTAKIDALTPWYKHPAWVWTTKYNGWPFSAEWLSAAFDHNQAPFFQSFIEVVVERSTGMVRLIPHGVDGPLKWSDFGRSPGLPAHDGELDLPAEWSFPLPSAAK
ncbi:MAG: metallophosphoesterase [Flavobacteriales bacterium]|nr:metallophosphoesterase [Flavobacteriales bacterium]